MRASAAVLVLVAALAAATKTIDDITKAAPTYDWHAARQRVRDAMMHEVNTYSNVTSARLAIRTALRDKQRAVWIVSGRILVHEDFLRKGGMKNNLHARFVKSLIKESSTAVSRRSPSPRLHMPSVNSPFTNAGTRSVKTRAGAT